MKTGFAASAIFLLVAGCGGQGRGHEDVDAEKANPLANAAEQPERSSAADPRTLIEPYVFEPYNKPDYPKLAKKLGAAWSRVQSVREAAAFKALGSGQCDYVELAEVSDQRTTKDNIAVFVDCRNLERVYVTEADISGDASVVTQSSKTIGRAQAIEACAQAAKNSAAFPSLVDAHTWAGASFSAAKTTGGARVLLNFDATNALGVELPYTANCVFPADGTPEITIAAR